MSRMVAHWEAAHALRAAAVAACEAGGHAPKLLRAVATAHGVTPRTLSRWRKAAREKALRARKPGRPAVPVERSVRQGLL